MALQLADQIVSDISCHFTLESVDQILGNNRVLGVIEHNGICHETGVPRSFNSGLPSIDNEQVKEVWVSKEPVNYGQDEDCYWAENGSVMLLGTWVKELMPGDLSIRTEQAYSNLLSFARKHGYSYLIRGWNYLADINVGDGDEERYRQFCAGRYSSLTSTGFEIEHFPAASAVGHHAGDALIYILVGNQACQHFENPQQTSAYRYPRQYGPRSPSFARATMYGGESDRLLFISGTASIVGHESLHSDDLEGQLHTTFNNLDVLCESVAEKSRLACTPKPQLLKAYVRHPENLSLIQQQIESHFGKSVAVAYLQADICRAELLVEVEGICFV